MGKFDLLLYTIPNVEKFEMYSRELDEVLKKLNDLQRRNKALLTKYNGDAKFVRIHKRVKEENRIRKERNEKAIISEYDTELFDILKEVKDEIDQKVYDRNDILKQDAFFEQTVMSLVSNAIDKKNIEINLSLSDIKLINNVNEFCNNK